MKIKDYKIIDLFAGGGGLSLGFQNAGFKVVAAFDNWKPAIELYRKNFGHPIFESDLGDVAHSTGEIKKFSPEMIIGGPPCQDFSSAGKRDEKGGRANLTVAFAEIVTRLRPNYFVMENVDRAVKSTAFLVARELFRRCGYGLTIKILDASYCGVPQIRKRLFVVGEYGGTDGFLNYFLDSYQSPKRLTVREYFRDQLGDNIDLQYYYRHPRSYKRRAVFSVDEPSPTIRGVNRPVPSGYPGHPGDPTDLDDNVRPLTTKERSLLQTFPSSFLLDGSKTDVEQIIGNAVPVKLGEFVASALATYIKEKNGRYVQQERTFSNYESGQIEG